MHYGDDLVEPAKPAAEPNALTTRPTPCAPIEKSIASYIGERFCSLVSTLSSSRTT